LNRIYLKEIARRSQESALVDKYREKIIQFKPDLTNLNFKHFELEGREVRYQGINFHSILNHFEPLPKVGLYFFQTKIIKTYAKNIIFGVCTG